MPWYTAEYASRFIRYEGLENYRRARDKGKGVLVLTGHLGAWELSSFYHSLMGLPMGVVMCLPMNWYEVVAYKTKMPVLWGAHGYGFKRIEPTFPRLLIPIGEVFDQYRVRYLLTMSGVIPPNVMAALPPATVLTSNDYQLYCFDTAQPRASERLHDLGQVAGGDLRLVGDLLVGQRSGRGAGQADQGSKRVFGGL